MSEEIDTDMTGSIANLADALCKAQGEMEGAKKTSNNPHFRSAYADLESVWDACREPLTKHGLAVIQSPMGDGDHVVLETMLVHTSGEFIRRKLPIRPTKQDPQGVGSAITYARRYALMAMVGLAPEDDDGNAASGGNQPQERDLTQERKQIAAAPSLDALAELWNKMDNQARHALEADKDRRKKQLQPEGGE